MRIYKNVDDIELIVGALLEKPVKGSMIGSTMMCIIRDQLVRIRMGDRYFYDLPKVFTQS
jgi:peroxidase